MDDEYIKGSRDNWEKIVLEYELLEAKHLKTLEEQIENRNLNLAGLNCRILPVLSNYVPTPSMCIPYPYESTEETKDCET